MIFNKLQFFILLSLFIVIILIGLNISVFTSRSLFTPKYKELTTQEAEALNESIINLRNNIALVRERNAETINRFRDTVAYMRERMRNDPTYRSRLLNEMMINQYEGLEKERTKVITNKQLPDASKKEIIAEIDKKMTEKEVSISVLLSTQTMERATNSMVFLTWVLVFIGVVQSGFLGYTIYLQHQHKSN